MIRNYLKTALRALWRNKQFALLNAAGLAIGLAVFLLIAELVAWEWGANRFNKNYGELYRLNVLYREGNADHYLPPGFAPLLQQQVPGIEKFTRVSDGIGAGLLSYQPAGKGEPRLYRGGSDVLYADSSFLKMFSFPVTEGTPVLSQPQSLALSEAVKTILFGNEEAIGKTVVVSNQFGKTPYTVAAVFRQPANSDIQAGVVLSLHTLATSANRDDNDWADPATTESGFTNLYFQLRPDADAKAIAAGITRFMHTLKPDSKADVAYLQPFSELHLAPSFNFPFQTFGNLTMVVVFIAIALLILGIAWINYINLSVAQSLNRAREIGVRKVLGANRRQLVWQYLSETFILTLVSTGLALVLVQLFQNPFNRFTGRPLSLDVLQQGWFLPCSTGLVLLGSLLAGSYTGIVLTSFQPVAALQHKIAVRTKGLSLRKVLVVFQFSISVLLLIATAVIYKQLQFMKTNHLGMNLEQLLVITGPTESSGEQAGRNAAFKNALAQLPFVQKQAASNNVPGVGYNFSTSGITNTAPQKDDAKKSYAMFICDQNFFDTYGISFSQGAAFSREDAERSWNKVRKVIVNEKAARQLGFDPKENLVGKKILWGEPFEIVGVVKDYHHLSLREEIRPTLYLGSVSYSFFTVKMDVTNLPAKLGQLKNLYKQFFPGNPFDYFFSDEKFNQQYGEDQRLGSLFVAAALVAVLIACLGLFGLAAFSARQRIKEIGIRKVLGASVADIAGLLSLDFIKLVAIAILVASPLAWWLTHRWLEAFAYRTTVSWWIFLAAGFAAISIAFSTVSLLAVNAARANPVKNLRTE